MKLLKGFSGEYSSSAKVVNGTLVLSLPDAKAPVVWRMDLNDIKAAAFEVREKGDSFVLVMKMLKGEAQEIAPFAGRDQALNALMAASEAMEYATTTTKADTTNANPAQKRKSQFLTGLIGVGVLILLIFGLIRLGPEAPGSLEGVNKGTATAQQTGDPGRPGTPGVPQSADDFLMQR